MPASVRRRLGLSTLRLSRRLAANAADARRLQRLMDPDTPPGPPVEIAVRRLDGARVSLRPGTSDAIALRDTFDEAFHRPSATIGAGDVILDLGANIGLTAADFAVQYPQARIVAVEMDEANAELARANTRAWSDRVELLHRAVWTEAQTITYVGSAGDEYGFHITGADSRPGELEREVQTVTVDELVDRVGVVAFLKMDIEGAEREVLAKNTDWAACVALIHVEVHGDYTTDDCARDLAALGFTTEVDEHHFAAVWGRR